MGVAAPSTDKPGTFNVLMRNSAYTGLDKRKATPKMFVSLYPRIPKTASMLLEFFIKRERMVSLMRQPLSHFCQEQTVPHAQECQLKLTKQVITYQDVRDMVENLVGLHKMCIKRHTEIVKELCTTARKLTIIMGEVATSLDEIAEVPVTNWLAIGDAIVNKVERLNPPKPLAFAMFIPRMRDFKNMKMLGAAGFGTQTWSVPTRWSFWVMGT